MYYLLSYISLYKKSLIVSAAVVYSLVFAYAQTSSAVTPPSTGSSTQVALIIADVSLSNATTTEKNGVYIGSYSLVGKMGQQNGIGVGIIVYDAQKNIVDEKSLVSGISIREGESKSFTYSYTVPKSLSGEVTVILKSEVASGLPLSSRILGVNKMSGRGSQVTCSLGTFTLSPEIICSLKQSGTLSLTTVNGSLFAIRSNKESKIGKAGETINFKLNLSPGKYYSIITQEESNEKVVVPLRVTGTYGSLLSINVSDNKGELRVTTVSKLSDDVAKATVEATLASKDGMPCGEGKSSFASYTPGVVFDISSLCKEGTISIKLLDGMRKVLDSRDEAFNVLNIKDIPTRKAPAVMPVTQTNVASLSIWQVVLVATIVLALVGVLYILILYIKKRKVSETPVGDSL